MALVDLTPTALAALAAGKDYFRIYRQPANDDWYALDVSVAAIAIGPKSDIDMISVTYLDTSSSTSLKELVVSVGNPWVATLEAQMLDVLPGSTTPGRILIGGPIAGTVYGRRINTTYTSPYLDVIIYFKTPASFPGSVRQPYFSDAAFSFAAGVAEQTVWTIPYYGRKNCSVHIYNRDSTLTITAWRLTGLRFVTSSVVIEHQISPASGSTNTIAALGTASHVLSDVRFDALRLYATQSASGVVLSRSYEATD